MKLKKKYCFLIHTKLEEKKSRKIISIKKVNNKKKERLYSFINLNSDFVSTNINNIAMNPKVGFSSFRQYNIKNYY